MARKATKRRGSTQRNRPHSKSTKRRKHIRKISKKRQRGGTCPHNFSACSKNWTAGWGCCLDIGAN